MHTVTVVEVVDGNTLAVWPPWNYGGRKGNLVQIHGLAAPPLDQARGELARCKLLLLVMGSLVQIRGVHGLSEDALICDVLYRGRDVADHLPEYIVHPESIPVHGDILTPPAVTFNLDGT